MRAYGAAFARVYNLLWTGFARDIAPRILDYFARSDNFALPLDEPEREGRVFVVASS